MAGGILIVVIVGVLLPIGAMMSGAVGAALLGWFLKEDVEQTHEGSELIELNG